MTLLTFTQQYSMPRTLGNEPTQRRKNVVVVVRPHCSPDPSGPKYEQYCHQSLMLHQSFRHITDLLAGCETYAAAYAGLLQTGNVPTSLEDDVYRLQQQQQQPTEYSITEVNITNIEH